MSGRAKQLWRGQFFIGSLHFNGLLTVCKTYYIKSKSRHQMSSVISLFNNNVARLTSRSTLV